MDADLSCIASFPAASDYLGDMYLIQRDYGKITNQMVAQRLGVSTSAVTQAAGRLKKLGLISQERYGDLHLTPKGRELAMKVLKRHYLLEHLLVRTLGYPWDKSDAEARVLQNHISADLADHLDELLGHPQTCPHGNPLPGASCEEDILGAPRLDTAEPGSTVEVLRITEEGEAIDVMLPWCQSWGIRPGTLLAVTGSDGDSMELSAPDGRCFSMKKGLAAHIAVRQAP